ncbi:MAG: hypothetical protein A2X75_02290 [Gallionellales bacterium GWE2_58_10]|nr:MAG: hypothetical protein A2X75_02290 [Gallionellales bacterium GWE2_58_10]
MQTVEEKIIYLERFDAAADRWFEGKYEHEEKEALRKTLNEMLPIARTLIQGAGCLKLISCGPPPAIGGMAISNANPFDMFFENYYGISFIPKIRDMTQQTIGVLHSHIEESKVNTKFKKIALELPVPEKVTLIWIAHNVPMKLWFMAAGILAATFVLGVKASTFGFIREIFGLS